jgi:hypothetical protein
MSEMSNKQDEEIIIDDVSEIWIIRMSGFVIHGYFVQVEPDVDLEPEIDPVPFVLAPTPAQVITL